MKWVRKINVVHDGCADKDTTSLCIILCYLVGSNIMELLILCMAQISLLKEKNKYIRIVAQ